MPQETILITSPLEDEQVARIRAAVPPHVEVVHDADLLPRPRFIADHIVVPLHLKSRVHGGAATIFNGRPR